MNEALKALTDKSNWDIQNTYVMGGSNFTVVTWLDGTPPIADAAEELKRLQRIEQIARNFLQLEDAGDIKYIYDDFAAALGVA